MQGNDNDAVRVCDDKTFPIFRQPDADSLILHLSGGLRAVRASGDFWVIEPVLSEGQPSSKGFFTRVQLQNFVRKVKLIPVAFHDIGWFEGCYNSTWRPVVGHRTNHFSGPADLWGNISSNQQHARSEQALRSLKKPTQAELADLLDSHSPSERLANSISLSLRNVDISVESSVQFYEEQLTNLLSRGPIDGNGSSNTQDLTLFAHVHSFFMHLGAARDYLAALLAYRIGKDPEKIDSLGRLLDAIRSDDFNSDAMLEVVRAKGFVRPSPANLNKWEASGWLKTASELRNEFVHRRPYGSKFVEKFGGVRPISSEQGLYRYFRPIVTNSSQQDVLDVIIHHYRHAMAFFRDMAEASELDIAPFAITDEDIVSIDEVYRK